MVEKYFLGLDIGTNSVGWAVTDTEYKLMKYKNKLMWGVHLFDEASQAEERRMHRTARRRLNRRNQRITLLNELFAKEILKIDSDFFMRLKESALLPEDFEHRKYNTFFEDLDYTDKEYFKEYPTIHHLICELIENKNPHDVRLVYYAVAYMLKHRGHFLSSVDKNNIAELSNFNPIYEEFYSALTEICAMEDKQPKFDFNPEIISDILRIKGSVKDKAAKLKTDLFGNEKSKNLKEDVINYELLVKYICGSKVKLSELFRIEKYAELDENLKSISVKSEDIEALEGQIDELHYDLVTKVKAMYECLLLADILKGNGEDDSNMLISKSKIEKYNAHKKDLKDLKYIVRKYLDDKSYHEMFKECSDKKNYTSYVYNAPSDKSRDKYKNCNQEDFCKFVGKYLDKIEKEKIENNDAAILVQLKEKCDDNTLCPKQVTTDNRVIPYQLYYYELKLILENASKYLDFLNESDEYGSVMDKILMLMEYRVPYYVGPLVSSEQSRNAWLVRNEGKENDRIYPWNFDEVVNKDECESEFIRRMTCKCTYMSGEDVLPKYSLLYSKFNVLNEINNIKIKGMPITVKQKQQLYEDEFLNKKSNLTKKKLVVYFKKCGDYEQLIEDDITGVDNNLKSSLKSYHDFKRLLESRMLTENDVERIIERITVTQDKERLKKWLKAEFPQLLEDDLKYVLKLKYKDYGRLSRKFLEELNFDYCTGELLADNNIITMLWNTNENLMELLSSKYPYSKALESYNDMLRSKPESRKTLDEKLSDMYIPAAVRRSITRTLDVVKDIRRVQKSDPKKIFIEMARGGEDKKGKRTQSRRDELEKFLKGEGKTELLDNLSKCDDGMLRGEKYYLYFKQLGKCMYTGDDIAFEDLSDEHKWNIDHIWPQAYIKDDSLDNKVLVSSKINGKKSDIYPLNFVDASIQSNMRSTWEYLRKKGNISEKKFQRLIRTTEFSDEERAGFIARQLVETRQSTKAVATLLKEIFPNSEIVYVKAGLVSEFRQEMDMVKCRDINDVHHAKDAYLNIVIGNVYNARFTHDPLKFVKKNKKYSIKLFKKGSNGENDKGMLSRVVERNGVVAWDPQKSFDVIKNMMAKNSIRYVRYCYKRNSGQNGGFYDQNPLRKKDGLVSIKNGFDTAKYGGYDNATISFFSPVMVESSGLMIIGVELLYADKFLNDVNFAKDYIVQTLSKGSKPKKNKKGISRDMISFPLKNRIIKVNTVLELDGYRVMMTSKTNDSIGTVSLETLVLKYEYERYIKKIFAFLDKRKTDKNLSVKNYMGFSKDMNVELFDVLVDKYLKSIFAKRYENEGKTLKENRDKFIGYDIDEQITIISQMVSLLKNGHKGGADFEKMNGSKNSGVKIISSRLDNLKKRYNKVYIIDQSPSGLSEMRSENLLEL